MIDDTGPVTRLMVHEAVCAERYLHIQATLKLLEEQNKTTMRILWGVASALLLAFLTVIIKFLFGVG